MPKIESIEKYKGRTMKLVLDEGEPVFISADIVQQFSLKPGISVPVPALRAVTFTPLILAPETFSPMRNTNSMMPILTEKTN